jgi:type I restriction enzyme R subunit
LVGYREIVDHRFEAWLQQQGQTGRVFTDEQMLWLEMIRDHIAASMGIGVDDFQLTPFAERGGVGKAAQLFEGLLSPLLDELNQELVA